MKDIYHIFLQKLAHFQVEHPIIVILFIVSLTVAMLGGATQVQTVASLEQMMPKNTPEIAAFNQIRDAHLGQDIVAIVIEVDSLSSNPDGIFDITDDRVLSYVKKLEKLIAQEPDIITTQSIVSQPNFEDFYNDQKTTTMLIAKTDVSANDQRMNLLVSKIKQNVQSVGVPEGITLSYTGTPIIQQRLGELIAKDRQSTQWISTLFVFILTALIFGTFSSALVPIAVVTISINWLYGTMGYTGLPISTLAGGVAAMVIGIGIDFAIHIMNKFKYERKKKLSIKKSIELAVVETGTALTATSLTTIAAFLAFLSGAMPEMGRFGILMAIGIGYALLFSLFGLPALLVLEERFISFIKKRASFGIEGELHLEKKHDR